MKLRLAVSVLIVCFSFSDLFAEAFFAGNVKSVNSDSSFNAMRNPALMSGQKSDSVGFFYYYLYNAYTDISGNVAYGAGVMDLNGSVKDKYNGIVSLSYVKKFQSSSLGIAIRNPEDTDQALINESTLDITSAAGPVSSEKKDKKSFATSTVISYSSDLGRNESVGIQFEIGASTASEIKSKHENAPVKDYKMEISTDKIIGNLNLGYRLATGRFEIGAILNFGEYIYENQKYSYNNNISPFSKSEKEISSYLYRNKGFEYTLGAGYNITNKLVFDYEITNGIPYKNGKKELKDDDYGVFAEKDEKKIVNLFWSTAGGFNYKYNQFLNFGFGGGAAIQKSEKIRSNGIKLGDTNYIIYSLLAGAEIKPTAGMNLFFGLSNYYRKQTMNEDSGIVSVNIDFDLLYVNALFGASTFF